jgi:hypothetical protein
MRRGQEKQTTEKVLYAFFDQYILIGFKKSFSVFNFVKHEEAKEWCLEGWEDPQQPSQFLCRQLFWELLL